MTIRGQMKLTKTISLLAAYVETWPLMSFCYLTDNGSNFAIHITAKLIIRLLEPISSNVNHRQTVELLDKVVSHLIRL